MIISIPTTMKDTLIKKDGSRPKDSIHDKKVKFAPTMLMIIERNPMNNKIKPITVNQDFFISRYS